MWQKILRWEKKKGALVPEHRQEILEIENNY